MEDLQERINKANNKMLTGDDPVGAPQASQEVPTQAPMPQATDYYQMSANAAQKASQSPTAYGSPAEMDQVVDSLVQDTTDRYYNAYKNQYEHLMDVNSPDKAKQLSQEYMTTYSLPLVASLVEQYGVDALLNNRKALSKLDQIMLTGNGVGDGFTEAYLKKMYYQTLGTNGTDSDVEVVRGLQKAMGLAEQEDIRGAVTLAKDLKEKIDRGELSASESDYTTLLRATESK